MVIVGGGPAGSAAAITARQLGCSVLVLEAERFPRHHVGESLVYLWSVFRALGVEDVMDATFQHKRGSTRIWGRDVRVRSSDFTEIAGASAPRNYSLQVERSLFDRLLLERAAAAGAEVRQEHRVLEVLWDGERAGNLGLEAVPWGWLWFIPLHDGTVSVGLVCDRSSRRELQRLGAERFLREAIAPSAMVRRLLVPARLAGEVRVTASHGYTSRRYAGDGWLLAGDAGSFFDPMWATGVGNALQDGILAGSAAEALARGRATPGEVAAYYDREMHRRADNINLLVKFVYHQHQLHEAHPFWQNRRRLYDGRPVGAREVQRLARDPSAPYFRTAFAGMGAAPEILAGMDAGLAHMRRQAASVGRDLDGWVPRLAPTTTLRPGLGLDPASGRLARGLEIDNAGFFEFTCAPATVAMLSAVDGRRTARQLVDGALDELPPAERASAWLALVSGLVHAHRRGIVTADERMTA